MKIAVTVVAIALAIGLACVAFSFWLDTPQSPITPDNTNTTVAIKQSDKQKLSFVSSHSLSLALIGTIEDGVYRCNDYSKFYRVSESGFSELADVKTAKTTIVVSGELCEIEIYYVETDGRVVGGGEYKTVLFQEGVYTIELNLKYTLTEMPSALNGEEGEKLLLVAFSSDDYYSEAFAVNLNSGNSRNLFNKGGRTTEISDGYVMLTDELVKNSDEYLYFFSSRLYDRESDDFNEYKSIDLFRTKGGEDELVARRAHHQYMSDLGAGNICFIRSEYAILTYEVGQSKSTTIQEMGFEVVHLNLATMTETVVMKSEDSYSLSFKRFGSYLVRLSPEISSTLEVFNMAKNERNLYEGMGMKTIAGFDVSDDGRYIAVGGSVSVASTINQNVCVIDTQSGQMASIKDKGIFLAIEGNFGFIGSGYFINASYDDNVTNVVFYITKTSKIIETFK